jgi:hypothetical protein
MLLGFKATGGTAVTLQGFDRAVQGAFKGGAMLLVWQRLVADPAQRSRQRGVSLEVLGIALGLAGRLGAVAQRFELNQGFEHIE